MTCNYLIMLFYLICCVITFGMMFAFFQREFSAISKDYIWHDILFSFCISLVGPISLLITVGITEAKHGLLYPTPTYIKRARANCYL